MMRKRGWVERGRGIGWDALCMVREA